jgi:signal transduction histidine kinase/CheY-like chemotaxis protein
LLLSRFAGVDWFDGTALRPVYYVPVDSAYAILPARADPGLFYVSETYGLSKIDEQPDCSFVRTRFLDLPDICTSLYEDLSGKLWIGTTTKGAFSYDPATKILSPVNDPETGKILPGPVMILGNDQRILVFFGGGILQFDADGQAVRPLKDISNFIPLGVSYTRNGQDILITYQRQRGATPLSYGVGVLSFDDREQASWRELDIPSLETIGPIRSLTFSEENDRPILWLGGTEGILRLDYDKIHTLQPPPAPIIKSDDSLRAVPTDRAANSFPFKDHHVRLMVFTGDYVRGKDWLIQTRMDGGEWANPSPRRAFEFTNLSEGEYHFEARALNSANMASAPATLTFNILPPWYRSGGAYTGYASGLALFVFGFIRVRERRIRSRNRELETMVARRTEELVKANAAKDEFLASVSHEIRNPMNGVIGIAESFKTDAFDPDSRHKFALLRQCATHLSSLLESLLDFSRLQAGVFELDSKPFDLPELMESIAALTAAESEKRRLPVEIAISPAVPRQLTGDPRRIGQILLNFVRNALNFSDHGQISVTVWCTAAGPGLTEVFFAVSDEGPGISPEEQKKLFTRFERGTAAQRGRVPGTGLGLALCRTLAEKMGGRIWLESELGQGSCFYFSAPFITEDKPIPPVAAINTPLQGGLKTALVVDDEEYNRIALADLLELLGFTVQTAADGQQAISLAGENDFDVIFLDYAMPGLSGLDVTRAIRILPNRSHQAVIFAVTAFNTPDKRTQCLAAGMNGFLGKPITMERLRQALAAAIPQETLMLQPPSEASTPIDPLARLRVLARKKGVPLSDELALYLSDLEAELEQLTSALQHEGVHESGHYAHLLCGRCVFIQEPELEFTLRKIGPAVATGRWNDARSLGGEVRTRVADLRIRLASDAPVAPRG